MVEFDCLRVSSVQVVVTTPVAQVDAPNERHISMARLPTPDDDQLLMVRTPSPNALIKQNFPASSIHPLCQCQILLLAEGHSLTM